MQPDGCSLVGVDRPDKNKPRTLKFDCDLNMEMTEGKIMDTLRGHPDP